MKNMRNTRLGSRAHARKEGHRDGSVGIPREDWSDVRPPSEQGFEALAATAQAQLGIEYYDKIDRLQAAWQATNRDLLRWQRRARRATEETARARRALDELHQRLSAEAEPR